MHIKHIGNFTFGPVIIVWGIFHYNYAFTDTWLIKETQLINEYMELYFITFTSRLIT